MKPPGANYVCYVTPVPLLHVAISQTATTSDLLMAKPSISRESRIGQNPQFAPIYGPIKHEPMPDGLFVSWMQNKVLTVCPGEKLPIMIAKEAKLKCFQFILYYPTLSKKILKCTYNHFNPSVSHVFLCPLYFDSLVFRNTVVLPGVWYTNAYCPVQLNKHTS